MVQFHGLIRMILSVLLSGEHTIHVLSLYADEILSSVYDILFA